MFSIIQLKPTHIKLYDEMNKLFAVAFDDEESYIDNKPTKKYINRLLKNKQFIPLVALKDSEIIGALVAYELIKFEQERSEIYIYDLAVGEEHRRQGIATKMILELINIAKQRNASVIFVQADKGQEDRPAISLYSKIGTKEEVLHFDIEVKNFT